MTTITNSNISTSAVKTPAIQFTDGDSALTIADGGAITSANGVAGNLTLNNGNLVVGTSGKGIDFSITSDADSGAGGVYGTTNEILNDYEEGTFTPYFHATNVTWSYNHQYGFYTKIGNKVTFEIYIAVSAASGSTSNQAYGWGLPYTCYNGSVSGRYSPAVCIGSWYNCGMIGGDETGMAYIDPNTDIIKLVFPVDGGVSAAVQAGDIKNGSFIYMSGQYMSS